MKSGNRPRFDVDALRRLAGDKVFVRGEVYHRDGQVEVLAVEPGRVVARVAGTDDYRTVLTGRGTRIDGECSCPAFRDWGFCKHMVAAALAANAAGAGGAADGAGTLARIREYLKERGVDALVATIVDLAERDEALLRKLDMAAAAAHGDDRTIGTRLSRALDAATRTGDFVEYREVPDWAARVDAVLDVVADVASGGRAGVALKLAERAIARVERAIEAIDDSNGHCGALLHRARDIHLAACRAVRPDPVELAGDLFAREMADGYDVFHGAAALYADVLGEDGLREYRRLAVDAWRKLPPRTGPHAFSGDRFHLEGMLDFFAERDGDVEARIAIRAGDLSSQWAYLRLAEFCLSQGRREEALRRAEDGLWTFEDVVPDERLVFFAADLMRKAGRKADAEALLWRSFEKAPSLELYDWLRRIAGKRARDRGVAHLVARRADGGPGHRRPPAELFVHVLMREKMFDEAWAAVGEGGIPAGVTLALARASDATHPDAALAVYAERVEAFVAAGGNPAYEEAAGLVARMAALRGAGDHAAYVSDLEARHRRKRNFVKLLR